MTSEELYTLATTNIDTFHNYLGGEFGVLPTVEVEATEETDYCGKLPVYGYDDCVTSAQMVLNLPNITYAAEVDKVTVKQMAEETIYHEWIHFMAACAHPDDVAICLAHEGELWDDMIIVGINEGWIKREEI